MAQHTASAANLVRDQWRLVILLMISVHVNHLDRGILSVAAPVLSAELALSPARLGFLLSAFSVTYSFALPFAGWIADRYIAKWVLGVGFFVWCLATSAVGFTQTFYGLFALRLLLGVGESVAYPSYSKMIASCFSQEQRGRVNSLIDVGAKIGPALATFAGSLAVAQFGWRALFLIVGILSLVWLPPWIKWAPRQNATTLSNTCRPGIGQIMARRQAWGTFLGHFAANYCAYFLLTWLPYFLVTIRHYSMKKMAVWGAAPLLACAASSLLGGWLSDRWIARGASPTIVRKGFVITGLLVPGVLLPATMARNQVLAMSLLVLALLMFGLHASNFMAITQTLAGTTAAGSWTGIQGCVANQAGILAPIVTGLIVSRTGSFALAFVSASMILILGAGSYFFLVGRVEQVEWRPSVGIPFQLNSGEGRIT
jgi:MFS transporter, ACS family, D-galactonate transporter